MDPAPQSEPLYFELSWAILSSIGLLNILFGFMVIGIVGPTPIALVPMVVSAACALANGLCYYAFYTHYPTTSTVVASAFADIFWMVSLAFCPWPSLWGEVSLRGLIIIILTPPALFVRLLNTPHGPV